LPELGRQNSKVLGMALQIGFGGQDASGTIGVGTSSSTVQRALERHD
jgi:hypothetical protein